MPQQKFTLKINKKYDKIEREAISQDVIDYIVKRTRELNKDKEGNTFEGYSPSYKASLDFKIAGKKKDAPVTLTLTGEMLDSLKLLTDRPGAVTIGYDADDKELNGKVEGNIKGTYGNKKSIGPKRDFLGISDTKLRSEVLINYKLTQKRDRRLNILKTLVGKDFGDKFKDEEIFSFADIEDRIREAINER